jgi:hypothetical protein
MTRVLLSAPLCPYSRLSSRFTCWPEIWIVPPQYPNPHLGRLSLSEDTLYHIIRVRRESAREECHKT